MNSTQCPKCAHDLEVRHTSPCFVCGAWYSEDELEKIIENSDFKIYGLLNGSEIALCTFCYLEDVLSNLGDLLEELKIRKEEASTCVRYLNDAEALITKDKYCVECEKRLSLLKVIVKQVDT